MKAIKGSYFGVRFYRRGTAKSVAPKMTNSKAPEQEDSNAQPAMQSSIKTDVAAAGEQSIPVCAKPPGVKEYKLWTAAYHDDCYAIRLLVMDGVDLDARDPKGRTALNIATQYGKTNAVKTLLAAKEMRFMAKVGELPETRFFQKFKNNQ